MKSKPRYVLGIDIGTSATKVLLIGVDGAQAGKVKAEASGTYRLFSPRPGWNEQEPEDWWKASVRAVRSALKTAKIAREQVVGIGLSGQMHGSVFLNANKRVLRKALLWNDQRTEKQCEEILQKSGGLQQLLRWVNNPSLPGFTAPKVLWFRENEPRLYEMLRYLLLPKDFVGLKLTGEIASDVSDASGTLLLDIQGRRWSNEILEALQIDKAILPPLLESVESRGILQPNAARELGLMPGIPVAAGAGDQPAAAVGMGVVRTGAVSATIGTSGVVFAHSDVMVRNEGGVLQSFCHAVPQKFCVFGCMLSAGASLEWMKSVLADKKTEISSLVKAAEKIPAGSNGLVFLPYLEGERCPHPDPHARGAWIGLHRSHGRAEMTRAVLEGVTFGMNDQIRLMNKLGVSISEVRCGGGGAKSKFWLQLQADIYGAATYSLATENASAFGAAVLAAVQAGVYETVSAACDQMVKNREKFTPIKKNVALLQKSYGAFEKLYPALKNEFEALASKMKP